jgi:MFS family permease
MPIPFIPRKNLPGVKTRTWNSLNYAVLDGVFWAVMVGMGESFIIPYSQFLKPSPIFASVLVGMSAFAVVIANFLGSMYFQKHPVRKPVTILTVVFQAVSWALMFLFSWYTADTIYILIFYFLGIFSASLSSSAWFSWMNQLVPEASRGKYWSVRTKIIVAVQTAATLIAGIVTHHFKNKGIPLVGFGIIFMISCAFRLMCVYTLSRQHEPKMIPAREDENISFTEFLAGLPKNNLGRFILFNCLFTFAVNFTPALFPVFFLQTVGLTLFQLSMISVMFNIAMFLLLPYWGRVTDTYGNYRTLQFTAIGIALIMIPWFLLRNFYLFLFIQIFSGFLWSGFSLASQNFILDNSKERQVHLTMAYISAINNMAVFAGALTGGLLLKIAQRLPLETISWLHLSNLRIETIFFASFVLRLIVGLFFLKSFNEIKKKKPVEDIIQVFMVNPIVETGLDLFTTARKTLIDQPAKILKKFKL